MCKSLRFSKTQNTFDKNVSSQYYQVSIGLLLLLFGFANDVDELRNNNEKKERVEGTAGSINSKAIFGVVVKLRQSYMQFSSLSLKGN